MPPVLPGLLSRHAADALVAKGPRSRTAADLVRDVDAIARALPDDVAGREVVLVAEDRYAFAAALIACTVRGAITALPPSAQPEMVSEIRHRENVATVLHDRAGMRGIDVGAILARDSPETGAYEPFSPLDPSDKLSG